MAQRGHEVTVATTRLGARSATEINGVQIREFDVSGNLARGMEGEVDEYRKFLVDGDFDVIMNYAAQQWTTDAALDVLDDIRAVKVFAPCGFSGLFDPMYAGYFARMPDFMRRYDGLVLHSTTYRDAAFVQEHGITNAVCIPNGAGEDEFVPAHPGFRVAHGIGERTPMLLTVGSHTGMKGHAEVMQAFRRARIGRAVLVIIGNLALGDGCQSSCMRTARKIAWLSVGRKRVLVLDPPRRDVLAAYEAADLFVFASNIECSPLVLFESVASRTPFIASDCGNAAEIAETTGGGVIVRTDRDALGFAHSSPADLAVAIEGALRDPVEVRRRGEVGRLAWEQNFTWERIVVTYEDLYRGLLDGARPSERAVHPAPEPAG
jgi:glycosyltransferase involved in cell wall biosynthesis